MEKLRVTVVGQDLFKIIDDKFEAAGLSLAYEIRTGMYGNLKTQTYIFELEDSEVIGTRKKFLNEVAKDSTRMTGLYMHGDWMRIFVMRPFRN